MCRVIDHRLRVWLLALRPHSQKLHVFGQMAGVKHAPLCLLRRIPLDPMTNTREWGMRSMQDDPKGGGIEHGARIFAASSCLHRPEVVGGVRETESAALLRTFFQKLR